MRQAFGLVALSVGCAATLAGCPPGQRFTFSWNQFHGDVANSGQVLTATQPAKDTNVLKGSVGPVAYSSPALAPDGSIYVSTFDKSASTAGNALLKISSSGIPVAINTIPIGGELSSPAVDAAGNVYVSQYFSQTQPSHLLGFQSDGQLKFNKVLTTEGSALAPPKVMTVGNGTLIFAPFAGGIPVGGHVQVFNDQGTLLQDLITCGTYTSVGTSPGFHISPIDLGPPYPEDPTVAIRTIQTEQGPLNYLVGASDHCGLIFYRFVLGTSAAIAPTFTDLKFVNSNAAWFSAPSISVDGTVVISDSGQRVTAYDVTTGKEKWHYKSASFVSAVPTMTTLGINFVYVASYDQLMKIDLSSGNVVAQIGVIGPTDASPAIGGQNIFVSTYSGLFTYDLNLNLLAFCPLMGGRSSPGIGSNGDVVVAGFDGTFFRFPGPP